ncbi:type II secretion system protein N [Stakelama saccharophila]|uniref:Type II secretion system protein N n=1 Tax=Stakelama saccharophila TaxID=3075605 RepID=A0ABZ0BBI2_9SPHN|nr:type II secretion system protein N [Stakelama sp. W311]WNO54787.1 type II secretion system protein N [Stakelama sp. W311]
MIADYRPTPRQIRTGLDLLAGAMVVSVAFALAGLTWRLAGHAGVGAITVPSADRPLTVSSDIGPALALEPFGRASPAQAADPTGIDARLTGIIFAVPSSLSTAYIAVGSKEPKDFAVGDRFAGATIRAIRRDRVILDNGGNAEYLAFPDPTLPEGAADRSGGDAPSASGSPAAPQAATPSAPSADALLSRFDATPTDGGYRIGDNAPAGLRAGDVIRSVNGQTVTDGAAARQAFASAAQSGTARIEIVRDGKTISLSVPIR